jgi:hypothetical protein
MMPPSPPSQGFKKKSLEYNINKLPEELKKYIYQEYIEIQLFYDNFKEALDSQESQMLNIVKIHPFIPLILAKPKYIKYFLLKLYCFKTIYNEHKIRRHKSFRLMNNGESFAQCILMYLYH